MILSDTEIQAAIVSDGLKIQPFRPDRIQPASYDIALSDKAWSVFAPFPGTIDLANPPKHIPGKYFQFEELKLRPQQFILVSTEEHFRIPCHLTAKLEGKSSLGRLGLVVHATAGYIDPGFEGHLTLELSNLSTFNLILRPGMLIGQIAFHRLGMAAVRPYGHPELHSRYQGQGEYPEPFKKQLESSLKTEENDA